MTETKPKQMIPVIHLNGTGIREIERQLNDAVQALDVAKAALIGAQPNGRDYYPLGPNAIHAALEQHRTRLKRVQDVRDELMEIWEGLPDHLT